MVVNIDYSMKDAFGDVKDYCMQKAWENRGALTQGTIGVVEGIIGVISMPESGSTLGTKLISTGCGLIAGIGFGNIIDAGLRIAYYGSDSTKYTTIETRAINWIRAMKNL